MLRCSREPSAVRSLSSNAPPNPTLLLPPGPRGRPADKTGGCVGWWWWLEVGESEGMWGAEVRGMWWKAEVSGGQQPYENIAFEPYLPESLYQVMNLRPPLTRQKEGEVSRFLVAFITPSPPLIPPPSLKEPPTPTHPPTHTPPPPKCGGSAAMNGALWCVPVTPVTVFTSI